MCTAITFHSESALFGRNLDIDLSYGEAITMIPRAFPLKYKYIEESQYHKAMLGMAIMKDGYPLFFDGVNEDGVAIAALNFTENASYGKHVANKINLAVFEFIPYILSKCQNIDDTISEISKINLTDDPFDAATPPAALHYLIADRDRAITAEPTKDGIKVYENKAGVLTNDPPFPFHTEYIKNYYALSNINSHQNNNLSEITGEIKSHSLGAFGLPGDYSSPSRFVRAAYLKNTSVKPKTISGTVNQAFHILSGVSVPKGAVRVEEGFYWRTEYTSLIDQRRLIYYVRTYDDPSLKAVRLGGIEGKEAVSYPLSFECKTEFLN